MKTKFALFIMLFCMMATQLFAQTQDALKGKAAFLFAYYPREGKSAQFYEGYKSHLDWHQTNNDPLVWYGWNVISGRRMGMFVDGTFGITFNAFDNRIKPAEDAANAKKTFTPFANPVYRKVFKLQPELSTVTPLEQWNPLRYIEAITFSLKPGKDLAFEKMLSQIITALQKDNVSPKFTVYRQLTGGELPSYLLMSHHNGYAAFSSDQVVTTLSYLIHRAFDNPKAQELIKQLSGYIQNTYAETWIYRRNLSYFPSYDD